MVMEAESDFCSEEERISGLVNDWQDDLRLDLKPAAGMIQDNPCGEIGCAANDDQSKLVIYLPFSLAGES